MKRLAITTVWYGQLKLNDTYFGDSWFGAVNTAEEIMAAVFDYCGSVKTSHKVFV